MQPSPLVRELARSLQRLDAPAGGIVVAVSGGPDSVALLRGILALRPEVGAGPLVVAHLNHRLRGAESDADEAFVRALHAIVTRSGPNVRLCCAEIDVDARARETGENLEKTARQLRYAWLAEMAHREQCRYVATGHTADDQAETVLHRLLRGTGLRGLRGIAFRRPLAEGVELMRPLLRTRRADVVQYLDAIGQAYRVDSSNRDRRLTRNRIRNELLPLMRQYNPRVDSVLCRLSRQAAATYRASEAQARKLLADAERPRAGRLLVFDRRCLAGAPRNLIREALRLAWLREGWSQRGMSFAGWDRLAGLVYAESALDLPGGIEARSNERLVQLGKRP